MEEKHTIDLGDLIKFVCEEKLLFAKSSREQKELYSTLVGSYEVWHKGVKVLETFQPFVATEKYNEL